MKDRLLAGAQADVLILTQAMMNELAAQGHARADTFCDLGAVATAMAVRSGETPCPCATAEELRASLLEADAIYFPDPKLATAGIHFARVLDKLGIAEAVSGRLRAHPNGATAMAALATSTVRRPLGCTQVTEILATPGVDLVAPLPAGYELATVYTAGVANLAQSPLAAAEFVGLLGGPWAAQARRDAGFGI